ncbi:50S ribosomal protein L9 [Thermaurantimonas aggregans]|uniref:Large ribosomal subunit protein bL9 n=1 Tax=Thermaurantimonas aggregans TaxID=2173829 RepID=A0A401XMA2_9FLAO|nr:50S ribosomal protein L9 [Thermaurantimonas aggregans]GCD78118.1 50S ribosomal protein L9 [Thermaurantimonas aggregans]
MEVILKTDVENLGFKDDIVDVKPGYARNYLIPQGMAILATESAKKVLAETLRQRAHKEAKIVEDARKLAESMQAVEIKLPVKVGKGNKLFGSVSNADLAAHLAGMGFHVDKKYIYIPGSVIKNTGKYTAKIRLHRNVQFDLEFEVVAQQ